MPNARASYATFACCARTDTRSVRRAWSVERTDSLPGKPPVPHHHAPWRRAGQTGPGNSCRFFASTAKVVTFLRFGAELPEKARVSFKLNARDLTPHAQYTQAASRAGYAFRLFAADIPDDFARAGNDGIGRVGGFARRNRFQRLGGFLVLGARGGIDFALVAFLRAHALLPCCSVSQGCTNPTCERGDRWPPSLTASG